MTALSCILAAASLLPLAADANAGAPLTPQQLHGSWVAVKWEGTGNGARNINIALAFEAGNNWVTVSQILMPTGPVKGQTRGSFNVENNQLRMTPNNGGKPITGVYDGQQLILQDPNLGAKIWFRRVGPWQ